MLGGAVSHIGHTLALPTMTCGCPDPYDPHEPQEQHHDPSVPSFSVGFSASAVIYEDAYEDAPGVTVQKRSTEVVVDVSIYGGDKGGRFVINKMNFGRLLQMEPVNIPSGGTVDPNDTLIRNVTCIAAAPSTEEGDVSISGYFVENETGNRINCAASQLTVFKVELRETEPALAAPFINRHTYGIAEKVRCIQLPSLPVLQWSATDGTFSFCNDDILYECPILQSSSGISAEKPGVTFHIPLQTIEPDEISCDHATFLPATNDIEGCGMLLKLVVLPCSVSFTGIKMQEIPANLANWQEWGSHSGYFDSYTFYHRWCHTVEYGAGRWMTISQGNVMGLDVSRMWYWPTPWSNGVLSWNIPYGWKHKDSVSDTCVGQISPPSYSVWSMGTNFLEKAKHTHRIGLSLSGQTFFDGNLQEGE